MSDDTKPIIDLGEIQNQAIDVAKPKLKALSDRLRSDFMERYGKYVNAEDKARLDELVRQGNELAMLAVTAKNDDEARQYANALTSIENSAATLRLKVEIVQEAKDANVLAEALGAVWDTIKSVGASLIGMLVQGVAKGAISSISGGEVTGDLLGGVKEFAGDLIGD